MNTRVVNIRIDSYDIYIGRGSIWGNPYSHLKNSKAQIVVETRDISIILYREYLIKCLKQGKITVNEILELDGKVLGCYCKPKPCHGDVIVSIIDDIKEGKEW